MAIDVRPVEAAPPTDDAARRCDDAPRRNGTHLVSGAIVAVGIGMVAVVAHDGSPHWQITRAVVMLHGSGSTRSTLIDRAEVLARHDYGVLLVDARGHGRSGGGAMDFGWYGDEDVAAAVTFLEGRPDVDADRIAVLGTSMGGEEAIGAAAGDDRIKAVIAEGATNRVTGDKAWLSDAYGWRGTVQEGLEWLIYNTADLLTDADQPGTLRDAARAAAPRPLLLIAGGAMPDEGKAGRYIQQAAPDSVELWVVPDSGHTQAPDTHPAEWEQRVTRFLDDALGDRSPS